LKVSGTVILGNSGTTNAVDNTPMISGGSNMTILGNLSLGAALNGNATMIVGGPGSDSSNVTVDGTSVTIGDAGKGTMVMGSGTTFLAPAATVVVGDQEGSAGSLEVTGLDSTGAFQDSTTTMKVEYLIVGSSSGGGGILTVDHQAELTVLSDMEVHLAGQVYVKDGGDLIVKGTLGALYGSFTVDGLGSQVEAGNVDIATIGEFDVTNGGEYDPNTPQVSTGNLVVNGSVRVGGTGSNLVASDSTVGFGGRVAASNGGLLLIKSRLTLESGTADASNGVIDVGVVGATPPPSIGPGTLYVGSTGVVFGGGSISASSSGIYDGVVENDGGVEASSLHGPLFIKGKVNPGAGIFKIDAGATLEFQEQINGATVWFTGEGAKLTLGLPDSFTNSSIYIGLNDTIELTNLVIKSAAAKGSFGTVEGHDYWFDPVLAVTDSAGTEHDYQLSGEYVDPNFTANGSDVTLSSSKSVAPVVADNITGARTSNILYRNDSSGDMWFEAMSSGSSAGWSQIGGSSTSYTAVGTGDFFRAGTDDLLFRNNSTGDTWIEAISNGAFASWSQIGGSDTHYSVVGVADFFGNGTDDILFRNNSTGDTWIEAISNGTSAGWSQVGGSDTTYAVVAVGDYFGNGTSDILFRNNSTGDTWFEAISNGASAGWNQIGGSNTSYTVKT
jgi:hypothetical protein